MSNVMDIVAELLTESPEIRNDSHPIRKKKSQASKSFSQDSRNLQHSIIKSQVITCNDCKHREEIPPHGSGCTYKTKGEYPNIWLVGEDSELFKPNVQ